MLYENVCIEGLGYVIPDHVVTSDWIEEQLAPVYKALGIPKGRIEQLTKIKERRWWDEGVTFSDAAAMAAEDVLEKTGIDRSEVQCLVNASVCRDYLEPATAAIIHHKIGLSPTAMNFDVGNACLGFLNGMLIVANMIELGQINTGLVVSGEGMREGHVSTLERLLGNSPDMQTFRDNLATFTLGSGSVAMILRRADKNRPPSGQTPSSAAAGRRLIGAYTYSQTRHHQLCVAQPTWMRTDSTTLLREGLKVIAAAWEGFKEELGWDASIVDKVFTHQVSEKQRVMGLKMIGLRDGIDYPTLTYLGNIASVSAPLCMAMGEEKGFLNDGDRVCMIGVGSGINSIILGIQW